MKFPLEALMVEKRKSIADISKEQWKDMFEKTIGACGIPRGYLGTPEELAQMTVDMLTNLSNALKEDQQIK